MRDYNIDEPLIMIIKAFYEDATSAIIQNNHLGEFFRTTVGSRQGCLLSLTLFNVFLENIMQKALTNYDSSFSINGRPICNLRFVDDIDLMAGSTEEHQDFSIRVERSSSAYGIEVSTQKSKRNTE